MAPRIESFVPEGSRERYTSMLDTQYAMIRADECFFVESDEHGKPLGSWSCVHSIRHAASLWGYSRAVYPQGSISANLHYYEALRAYFGGDLPASDEFRQLRSGLANFLRLRRDDSSPTKTNLFGSTFDVEETKGGLNVWSFRHIDVSLRHSTTGLLVLMREARNRSNSLLLESIEATLARLREYLDGRADWEIDEFRHLTLSSSISFCKEVESLYLDTERAERAAALRRASEELIFSPQCLVETITGECSWRLPTVEENGLCRFEYFLTGFALSMSPGLLSDSRAQGILQSMLENAVNSEAGAGIPIHALLGFEERAEARPDFGASATAASLLWYCLENEVGGAEWLARCKESLAGLIGFCTSSYADPEYYIHPYLEGVTKALFLPRLDPPNRDDVAAAVAEIKRRIAVEKGQPTKGGRGMLDGGEIPERLSHLPSLVAMWNIGQNWSKEKGHGWEWVSDSRLVAELGGLFLGGFWRSANL